MKPQNETAVRKLGLKNPIGKRFIKEFGGAKKGEFVTIIGSNGAGKSTLLKLLVGLYYPEKGSLYVDGERIDLIGYQGYRPAAFLKRLFISNDLINICVQFSNVNMGKHLGAEQILPVSIRVQSP